MRYASKALFWVLLLCGLFFYPYAPGSWPSLAIDSYLRGPANASALVIGCSGQQVGVEGRLITGAFPLEIVKACSLLAARCSLLAARCSLLAARCSLLAAQAFYAGAVLAFPATARRKLIGVTAAAVLLAVLNVLRIAALYFIGLHAPTHFDALHEEWLPALLVVAACLTFAAFLSWAARGDAPVTVS